MVESALRSRLSPAFLSAHWSAGAALQAAALAAAGGRRTGPLSVARSPCCSYCRPQARSDERGKGGDGAQRAAPPLGFAGRTFSAHGNGLRAILHRSDCAATGSEARDALSCRRPTWRRRTPPAPELPRSRLWRSPCCYNCKMRENAGPVRTSGAKWPMGGWPLHPPQRAERAITYPGCEPNEMLQLVGPSRQGYRAR